MPIIDSDAEAESFRTFLACCGVEHSILLNNDRAQLLELYTVTCREINRQTPARTIAELQMIVNDDFRKLPAFSSLDPDRLQSVAQNLIISLPWLIDILILDHRYTLFFEILKFTKDSAHKLMEKAFTLLIYQPWNNKAPKKLSEGLIANLFVCSPQEIPTLGLESSLVLLLAWWFERIPNATAPELDLFFAGLLYQQTAPVRRFNKWELWNIVNNRRINSGRFIHDAPYLAGFFMLFLSSDKWSCVEEMRPKGKFETALKKEWEYRIKDPNMSPEAHMLKWFREIIAEGKSLIDLPVPPSPEDQEKSNSAPVAVETPGNVPESAPLTFPHKKGKYRIKLTVAMYADTPIKEGRITHKVNVVKLGKLFGIEGLSRGKATLIRQGAESSEESPAKRIRVADPVPVLNTLRDGRLEDAF